MYGARGTPTGEIFRKHLLALISDMIHVEEGDIFLYESDGNEKPGLVDEVLSRKIPIFHPLELAVPLFIREEIAGAIYLKRAYAFGDTETEILVAIAQVASLALENAFHLEWLQGEVKRLERVLGIECELYGESPAMVALRASVGRVAPSEATVLITGESGTGKELVARAIHANSKRSPKPFVAINCAALTETLLESELFGHEKGAFTGAFAQKRGKLEMAAGGTVFLDELGEMPLSLQAKLLRVLQHREVERVGGTKLVPLDFRLVAATNRHLEDAVKQGGFRADLFYRLNVVMLRTPPLRQRPEDIVPLAMHFLARYGEKCGRTVARIAPEARALLRAYEWPGNVRELENAMERAMVLGCGEMVRAEDLPDALREMPGAEACGLLHDAVRQAKRVAVERAFEQAGNQHEEAARLLGVHPNYLYRLIKNMA
jgi:transcriptional regulator with PAS, ATPase and Fis domain